MSKFDPSPAKWSRDDVLGWAHNVGIPENAINALYDNEVDGIVLLTLTKAELKTELSIASLASRRFLWDAIQLIRTKHEVEDFSTAVELYNQEIFYFEQESKLEKNDAEETNLALTKILREDVKQQRQSIFDSRLAQDFQGLTLNHQFYEDAEYAAETQARNDAIRLQEEFDHAYALNLQNESRHQRRRRGTPLGTPGQDTSSMKSLMKLCIDTCSKNKINVAEALENGNIQVIKHNKEEFFDETVSELSFDLKSKAKARGNNKISLQKEISLPRITKCDVCFEPNQYGFELACDHRNCKKCMTSLLKCALGDVSLLPLRCCELPIDMHVATICLDNENAEKIQAKAIEKQAKNKMYCPDCSCFINLDYVDACEGSQLICPQCAIELCAVCKSKGHDGITCDENRASLPENQDELTLSLIRSKDWKKCPSCGHVIELSQGCNHMTCPCGTEFCYRCGSLWGKNKFGESSCTTGKCANWDEEMLLQGAEARVQEMEQARGALFQPEQRRIQVNNARRALCTNEDCTHNFVRRNMRHRTCESCGFYLNIYGMVCESDCQSTVCYTCAHHRLPRVGWR